MCDPIQCTNAVTFDENAVSKVTILDLSARQGGNDTNEDEHRQ